MLNDKKILQELQRAFDHRNYDGADFLFKYVYNKYQGLVYYIAVNYLKNDEDSKIITKRVFINLFDDLIENKVDNIRYYLANNTKEEAMKVMKLQTRDIVYKINIAKIKARNENRNCKLYKLYKELRNEHFDLVVLHLVYGLSFKEISKLVNKDDKVLKKEYHLITRKIKHIRLMQDEFHDELNCKLKYQEVIQNIDIEDKVDNYILPKKKTINFKPSYIIVPLVILLVAIAIFIPIRNNYMEKQKYKVNNKPPLPAIIDDKLAYSYDVVNLLIKDDHKPILINNQTFITNRTDLETIFDDILTNDEENSSKCDDYDEEFFTKYNLGCFVVSDNSDYNLRISQIYVDGTELVVDVNKVTSSNKISDTANVCCISVPKKLNLTKIIINIK